MVKQKIYNTAISVALTLILAYVFPRIHYYPGAGAADLSTYLLIALAVGVIIFKVIGLRRRRLERP